MDPFKSLCFPVYDWVFKDLQFLCHYASLMLSGDKSARKGKDGNPPSGKGGGGTPSGEGGGTPKGKGG